MYDRGVKRASDLRRKLQSFRKKQRCRERNSEQQTETGTLSPSSQAHAGGFSGRTTRSGQPWGSTETVQLCTDTAGGDRCRSPLCGKQAFDYAAILNAKIHCSEVLRKDVKGSLDYKKGERLTV